MEPIWLLAILACPLVMGVMMFASLKADALALESFPDPRLAGIGEDTLHSALFGSTTGRAYDLSEHNLLHDIRAALDAGDKITR